MKNKYFCKISVCIFSFVFVSLVYAETSKQADELFYEGIRLYENYQYRPAIEKFEQAAEINKKLGESGKSDLGNLYGWIGYCYKMLAEYDQALDYYQKALAINEELGQKDKIAIRLNNIGGVYRVWGQYDKAIEYYQKALAIAEELGQKDKIAVLLNNIGSVYCSWGQYDKALDYYQKALAIDEELGVKDGIAIDLSNIGGVYRVWGQYDKAIDYYQKALAIAEELGQKDKIAVYLNNIGGVYDSWGQYDKAIEFYQKALAIDEELGIKDGIARDLNNIGSAYWYLKEYKKAEEYLNKSVSIYEELRLTAKGDVRRDYLASQIGTYRWLISTYIRDNKQDLAFDTIELSSAKYLAEQIGEKLDEKNFKFKGIKNYQNKLNEKTAIISYANINWNESTQIVVDKNNIYGIEVEDKQFIENVNKKYKDIITKETEKLRGVKIKKKEDKIEKIEKREEEIDKIINYYRLLLINPAPNKEEKSAREYISKELYKFLFGSLEDNLKDKTELIIIPSGILAFVPFETLMMPDGMYLIEKYHIKYTQSLTVSELIEKREYSGSRKPLIAFGGAVYDEISYKTDMVESEKQLENLKKETLLAMNRGQSTRDAYSSLGLAEWVNLPGTLTEVKEVKNIVQGADVYTGEMVDEFRIKELSKKGELKNYRILHFATHGLVVPEVPELSAVVLSLFKQEKNNEDGYLRMKEIAELDINADFVNLSACETGLGKIYGGEGVVGLTQSFLVAGANGLSVSLWQVADESTMKFMLGMYKLLRKKG